MVEVAAERHSFNIGDFQWFIHLTNGEHHSYPWGTLNSETGKAPAISKLTLSEWTNKTNKTSAYNNDI